MKQASFRLFLMVHSVFDWVLGAFILLAPGSALQLSGWWAADETLVRLIGAALLAFGTGTWVMRDMKIKAARPYLAFLLVWNFAALVAMFDALAYAQHAALVPVIIFAVFAGLFSYFSREWPKLPFRRAAKRSSRRSSTAQLTAR